MSGRTSDERRFTVGVSARGGIRAGGTLIIRDGLLECQLGRAARTFAGGARVQHAGTAVNLYRARLVPFWFNVSLVIDDGETAILASKSTFELRALQEALRKAGFQVRVRRTWVYRGLRFPEILAGRKFRPS